ncbi:MAG: hypothetical protein L6R30_16030 [Thermoanaerobaculia bacterium]|nr:hypothetical protein [Thermoanaerobaculia bacterium]
MRGHPKPENQFLRLTVRTASNFGSESGSATIDRPVSLDVWRQLPFIPASALKGVIAGALGNVFEGGMLNQRRAIQNGFGSPDSGEGADFSPGVPSKVILGDGDLLAFPLLLGDGRRVLVFPASNVRGFALLEGSGLAHPPRLPDDAYAGTFDEGLVPGRPSQLYRDVSKEARRTLEVLLGQSLPGFILAGASAASRLWLHAAEERTLTALDNDEKTVKGKSLRRCELVPPGTVFLSFVTVRAGPEIDWSTFSRVQLGAWEATGCGFTKLEAVELAAVPPAQANSTVQRPPVQEPREEHVQMRLAFEAVSNAAARPEASKVRTILREFGPRVRTRGLTKALGFCLAKARPMTRKPSLESQAYCWFLGAVLAVRKDELFDAVSRIAGGVDPAPPDIEERAVWLSKYSEALLPEREEEGNE